MRFELLNLFILAMVCSALPIWDEARSRADTIEDLVAGLQRTTLTADELRGFETELIELPAEKVLPLLLPLLSQGMPSGLIWNGSTLDADMEAPRDWRVFYSVNRVWGALAGKNPEIAGNLLAAACSESKSGREKAVLLVQMRNYWNENAENVAAEIVRSWRKEPEAWLVAAGCLAEHHRKKYDDLLVRVLTELPDDNPQHKSRYIRELVNHRNKALFIALKRHNSTPRTAVPSMNHEILDIGYSLIDKLEKRNAGSAYFLAVDMGQYVGQDFKPDQNDRRFKTEGGGLNEAFFAETTSNALRWWRLNKKSVLEIK